MPNTCCNENKETCCRMHPVDHLLVAGILLGTMTKLRIAGLPVGPGEIFILLWGGLRLLTGNRIYDGNRDRDLLAVYYWVVMAVSFSIGTLVNYLFFGYGIMVHNIIAYFFAFFIIMILSYRVSCEELAEIIKHIILAGTLVFGGLYAMSQGGSIREFTYFVNVRYTGGAVNPNTLAFFFAPLPGAAVFFTANSFKRRLFLHSMGWSGIFILTLFIGFKTMSDAFIAAQALALVFYIYLSAFRMFAGNRGGRIVMLLLMGLVIMLFFYDAVTVFIRDWFRAFDRDGSRSRLWLDGISQTMRSWLLGLGPGHFAGEGNRWEAHNTFIDFAMQGGILFTGYYLYLLIHIFNRLTGNLLICTSFMSLVFFSVGNFIGRQPVFYVFMYFYLCCAIETEDLHRGSVRQRVCSTGGEFL